MPHSTGRHHAAHGGSHPRLPEVTSCHYISGAGTFELQVVARDLESFSRFVRNVLLRLPNVKDVHTSFSLGEVKSSSALPLGHLQPRRPARG
jgi:DNA-binding Lrp family transcriptional regulator